MVSYSDLNVKVISMPLNQARLFLWCSAVPWGSWDQHQWDMLGWRGWVVVCVGLGRVKQTHHVAMVVCQNLGLHPDLPLAHHTPANGLSQPCRVIPTNLIPSSHQAATPAGSCHHAPPQRWRKSPKDGPPLLHSQVLLISALATNGVSLLPAVTLICLAPPGREVGPMAGAACCPTRLGNGPRCSLLAVAVTPPSSQDGFDVNVRGPAAQFKAKHLQGQYKCVARAEIPRLLGCAGCNACLAAGRRHSLLPLCPLVCWRGCHMHCLLDIRCASSRDPGQAVFMPDPSAALPGLVRCSLYWRALSFRLWARGRRISPGPHWCGSCLLGLPWVAFQVTGDQQRGTTAAGRGNLLIRYPPCFLPAGKCFDQLVQAPCQTQGPVEHP